MNTYNAIRISCEYFSNVGIRVQILTKVNIARLVHKGRCSVIPPHIDSDIGAQICRSHWDSVVLKGHNSLVVEKVKRWFNLQKILFFKRKYLQSENRQGNLRQNLFLIFVIDNLESFEIKEKKKLHKNAS